MTDRASSFPSPLVAVTLLVVLLAACGPTAPATGPVASVPPTAAPIATPLPTPAKVTLSPPAPACMNEDGAVFTVPVGPDGVQYGAEQTGPMALAVATDGTFWIADTQGNRLLHYDSQGVLVNGIDLNGHGIGVADVQVIGSDVNALVVGYGEKVLRFTADGNLLATYDIPEGLRPGGGLTGLAVGDHGEVLLEFEMDAEVTQLVDAKGALEPVPLPGYTHEGQLYKSELAGWQKNHGSVTVGRSRIEVAVPNVLAGLRILGFGPAGHFYVVVDEMVSTPTVWVDQTVRLYGPGGELLGLARVPLVERYAYVQNGLAVGPDGCVYALLTHPERVDVVRLGFSAELEPILPTPAPSTPSPAPLTSTPAPTHTPTPAVELELSVATYPLVKLPAPESDVLDFASSVEGDPLARHAAKRAQHFADSTCSVAGDFGYCVTLGVDRFVARMDYTDPEAGYVVVTRNEEEVSRVPVGSAGAIPGLWGLWAYDGHWTVETAWVDVVQSGNVFTSTATGQVVVDGVSLNDELRYSETFGFQTLGGKPFYFFEHQGTVDASYDGVDISLGFDEVLHLLCCSAAAFNPEPHPNLVSFYGRKADTWYYGEMAVVPVTADETTGAKSSDLTPTAVPGMPQVVSEGTLDCTPAGTFSHCVDDALGIEFEVPASWGEIKTRLATGGYAGYAYDYYFHGKTHAETEPLVAGGRSVDFSEGRGAMPTDFGGYEHPGWQGTSACDSRWNNSYPLCRQVSDNVAWMIRFPDASVLCEDVLGNWQTMPVFRIEISLPDNPTINGFVFEAPFFSEQFAGRVENELYPLLGARVDWRPSKCDASGRESFNALHTAMIESIINQTSDGETLENMDELIHLAESITVRER